MAQETDCIFSYIQKGVSLSAFYLGRCLERGTGIKKNIPLAQKYYMKVSFIQFLIRNEMDFNLEVVSLEHIQMVLLLLSSFYCNSL